MMVTEHPLLFGFSEKSLRPAVWGHMQSCGRRLLGESVCWTEQG